MTDQNLIISPSILAGSFARASSLLESIADSGTDYVHLDVMDGCFVPNITFGAKFIRDIREGSDLVFDTHLMIEEPEKLIPSFLDAGCNIITIHQEATRHLDRALGMIRDGGSECGVAINPATPVSTIEAILPVVDYVLIMSVNPGFGGQRFIPYTAKKIEALSNLRENEGYQYRISVDGGVNGKNIRLLYDAGADIAVMGTAFFSATDKKAFMDSIRHILEEE
ncbi:MAG: ribulose-phosphate 3-epimerase [Candidatus Ornithospirochaeta sp.]|nr:ribulose-phosphate 3-epimerase [Candidatus Ornithospirochaeta sp.]